jgi:transposase-like protein
MVKQEKRFYSKEFREQVLSAYHSSNESVSMIAQRFDVGKDTVGSWIYRERLAGASGKKAKFVPLETAVMKEKEMTSEEKDLRIKELERALSIEKMRSASLEKMIEIAGRELKIDIRKKSGAKQSTK